MEDNWFEDHDKLSEDQKKILFNELKKFTEYGDAVYQETDLNKLAAKFEAVTEYAKRYLNEKASDSFDQVTINRNVKELEKKVRKFKKEAEKAQKHQNRLTALYDDIGIIFDRYFGVGDTESADTIQESKQRKMRLTESKLRNIIRKEIKKSVVEARNRHTLWIGYRDILDAFDVLDRNGIEVSDSYQASDQRYEVFVFDSRKSLRQAKEALDKAGLKVMFN